MDSNTFKCSGFDEVMCPYCGYQYQDGWEFPEHCINECENCNNKFEIEREIFITYTTSRLTNGHEE